MKPSPWDAETSDTAVVLSASVVDALMYERMIAMLAAGEAKTWKLDERTIVNCYLM